MTTATRVKRKIMNVKKDYGIRVTNPNGDMTYPTPSPNTLN